MLLNTQTHKATSIQLFIHPLISGLRSPSYCFLFLFSGSFFWISFVQNFINHNSENHASLLKKHHLNRIVHLSSIICLILTGIFKSILCLFYSLFFWYEQFKFFWNLNSIIMILDSAMELALSLEKLTNEKLLLLHSVRLLSFLVLSSFGFCCLNLGSMDNDV